MMTYEAQLSCDINWAFEEADRYFAGKSCVHQTMRQVTSRLDDSGIDYAIVGAMAMFFHGYRRFTEDVDIVLTLAGLEQLDRQLLGDGYVRPRECQRSIREIETGVAIHILIAGEYPGDRKPAPIRIPQPRDVVELLDGLRIMKLAPLLELKMAAGRCGHLLRHRADAQEMIKVLDLPREWASNLVPSFHGEYYELWKYAQIAKSDDY